MTDKTPMEHIRREYGELQLDESTAPTDPLIQFQQWFEEVLKTEISDPTAMVLSTVDEKNLPDSRVVLLKALLDGGFIFYTNYQSTKAMQLQAIPYAALNFYWAQMARQVRIRGRVKFTTKELSDQYFASRPLKSQFSAIISPQSQIIESRKTIEQELNRLIEEHGKGPVMRPDYWGGYIVLPDEFEFWQGRDNRLHDRIHYYKSKGKWVHRRLAP